MENQNRPEFDWSKTAQVFAIYIGLSGGAIGGMLHFLSVGIGEPEFQYFVLQLSGFVIIAIFFCTILAAIGLLVSQSATLEQKVEHWKYAKVAIRAVTSVLVVGLGLSGYFMMILGGELFGEALREYVQSVKAQITP